MAMIGRPGHHRRPILGAVSLTILSEALRSLEELVKIDIRLIIYGPVFDPDHPVHARGPGGGHQSAWARVKGGR